jgi:hypothetical protein
MPRDVAGVSVVPIEFMRHQACMALLYIRTDRQSGNPLAPTGGSYRFSDFFEHCGPLNRRKTSHRICSENIRSERACSLNAVFALADARSMAITGSRTDAGPYRIHENMTTRADFEPTLRGKSRPPDRHWRGVTSTRR